VDDIKREIEALIRCTATRAATWNGSRGISTRAWWPGTRPSDSSKSSRGTSSLSLTT